jgi:uridylate kinase
MAKRVILKISGELLGSDEYNFDNGQAARMCEVIETLAANGYEVACVMGGGNIVRGNKLSKRGFKNEVIADQMGMLATIQNGLFLTESLHQRGKLEARLLSNLNVNTLVEPFSYARARKLLEAGKVLLIAGGTGKPGFTTDMATVTQAFELHCATVIKTTKVDGAYDKDPHKHADAVRHERLTYDDVLRNPDFELMDRAALGFASDKRITIAICPPEPDAVLAVLKGDTSRGSILSYKP